MGDKSYEGVRAASKSSIEIDFYYQGIRCKERIKLKPSPTNLRKASLHRAAVLASIDEGTFEYAHTFPDSKNAHKFTATDYTVESYFREWLENQKVSLKTSTWNEYRKVIDYKLIPRFGKKMLYELIRKDFRLWGAEMTCSNKSIANIFSPIRIALKEAVDDEIISRNPLYGWTYKRKEPPKEHNDAIDPFTEIEQAEILKVCVETERNQIIVSLWTGIRPSELIALEWDDIDFKNKIIKIRKGLTDFANTPESPKTNAGNRDVDMLPPVIAALKNQRKYALLKHKAVFFNHRTGNPWMGARQLRHKFWANIMKRTKVRYRYPYQMRHTYASMMLSSGEPLSWVAKQMGHSNPIVTAKTYARWLPKKSDVPGGKALADYGGFLKDI